ncbi:thiamine phosphate synthase [Fructilactobacillus sp. Tb1]|uniref:thiamine phosphate synthase n=1 Tax=Fructilactobacillus sp. Tb1 TaxID=3422304 RepID=UPI003D2A86CF
MKFKPEMLDVYLVIGTQNTDNSAKHLLAIVQAACAAGVTAVQYREKDGSQLSDTERVELGKLIHKITQKYAVPLFVDDDYELAKTIGAEGLHVGQTDEKVHVIRKQSPDLIIGLSIHDLAELQSSATELELVDYIGVGPIFPTHSKKDVKASIGVAGLDKVAAHTNLPIVAIGGIHTNNVAELKNAPIDGVSVISAITKSDDIDQTVQILKARGN